MADTVKCNQYVFTWKIKNFLSCYFKHNKRIVSPTFEVSGVPVKNWKFWLYPKGCEDNEVMKYDSVAYIVGVKPDEDSESIILDMRLDFLNAVGCVLMSREHEKYEMKENGYIYGAFFHTIEELYQLMKNWDEDTLTIRCIMTDTIDEKKEKIYSTESKAVTILDVDRLIFKWDVSNLGCFDWSANMPLLNREMADVKISMTAPDEAIETRIQMLSVPSSRELVIFRMVFLSACGIKLASKCETHLFQSTDPWLFPTFINKKDLYFGNSSPPCYKYTFICECIISKKSISWSKIENLTFKSVVENETKTEASYSSTLQHDFRELFTSKKFSDVKLRLSSRDFLAHKAVLAARSPVFSTMFEQDMLENQTGIVEIEDVDENTLKSLLEFVYTDFVSELDCESALKLLLAADKYQILNLKDKCTSIILSMLSVENVCEVILVADMINHEHLKSFSLNLISENVSKVLSAPSWSLWVERNMKLAAEVLCKVSEYLKREKKD